MIFDQDTQMVLVLAILRNLSSEMKWLSIFQLENNGLYREHDLRKVLSNLYDKKMVVQTSYRRTTFYAITQKGLDYLISNSSGP